MQLRLNRPKRSKAVPVDRRRVNMARACLIGSVFVYLCLADIAARMLPNQYFIAFVFVFFAAHSTAYLLLKEVRGYDDDKPS